MIITTLTLLGALNAGVDARAQANAPVTARALETGEWRRVRSRHADLYFPPGFALDAAQRDAARRADDAIEANIAWLGEKSPGARLNLFFVRSRDDMRTVIGAPTRGWSEVKQGAAFFVSDSRGSAAFTHETMHLLSWRLWGVPGGAWMSEGLATAANGTCHGWTIAETASALYAARRLPTITALRRSFRTAGTQGVVNYLGAASLIFYIDSTYGRDKLKRLWQNGGLGKAREILGVNVIVLERDWRLAVGSPTPPTAWNSMARDIDREGCEWTRDRSNGI
jgi:hypothetical protein